MQNSNNNNNQIKIPIFKIILLGDTSTGKTSFLSQLIHSNANSQRMPKPTTSLSYFTLRLSHVSNYIIQIWDSPGDQRFYYQVISILNQFNAVLLFIDVLNDHTYKKAKSSISQLMLYKDLTIHIVESKVNLVQKNPHKRKVQRQELQSLVNLTGGALFSYNQRQKLDDVIQTVIKWKKRKPIQESSYYKQKVQNKSKNPDPFCQCQIF